MVVYKCSAFVRESGVGVYGYGDASINLRRKTT